jgi:3-deoxy-manno-octulosonate cytidylyltransferase (CMP-KDO synthetase)
MSKTAIIIPARYGSSRLEGKPLLKVAGKPVIQWVYEKALQAKLADIVIVATDDKRIYDCVVEFGGLVEMTSVDHKCGSDRIMEVVSRHPEISYICNLQGDEPLIEPESIDAVIKR